MKKTLIGLVLTLSVSATAQQSGPIHPPTEPVSIKAVEASVGPSYSDINCAGFLSKENFNSANQVAGGQDTPNQSLYAGRNVIFVSGTGYQEGARYTVIRALRDINRYEPYRGNRNDLAAAGEPYAELGHIRILGLRGSVAVADVEFSCQPMLAGDLVVPFIEHPPVTVTKERTIDRYPADSGKLSARIIMSSNFEFLLGRGQKVYINAGSDQGVKVGDFFRAVRAYAPDQLDPVEALSYKAPLGEDTQKYPVKLTADKAKELPKRNLGELLVLTVTPTSSTALITTSLETIEVGDRVELENAQ